jgi:hypothetical protein
VPAEPIEEVVAPLPALPASTPPAQISKRTIPTIVEPEPVKVVKEKPVKKKERILKLPAAIMGAKPGSEPNVKHLAQEGDTKRKIKTVSTTASQNTVPVYGSSGFTVLPASASFGQVKAGTEHSVQLTITNIGMDSARYTIRQPKTPGINVRYKHGPIAPGMSAKLVISLNIQNPTDTLEIKDEFQLVSETEILHVPVKAIVSQ